MTAAEVLGEMAPLNGSAVNSGNRSTIRDLCTRKCAIDGGMESNIGMYLQDEAFILFVLFTSFIAEHYSIVENDSRQGSWHMYKFDCTLLRT